MARLGLKDLIRRRRYFARRYGNIKTYTFGIIYGRAFTPEQVANAAAARRAAYWNLRRAADAVYVREYNIERGIRG